MGGRYELPHGALQSRKRSSAAPPTRAYGYFSPTPEYYDAIIRWQKERNDVEGVLPEHIGYENGVLGGVISALTAFAAPGDGVLLHSPTYIGFTGCITNNGYKIVHSPLYLDEQGVWRMDFEDMDRKLKENHIHVAVFCSPHNPTGRVCGSAGRSRRRWRSTKPTTALSFRTKSGPT